MRKVVTILWNVFILIPFILSAQVNESLNSTNTQIEWKVIPQQEINNIAEIFSPSYDSDKWIKAIVPGTVFTSYVAAGLEKDPNFGNNIYEVDKTKYDRSFVYRLAFDYPSQFDKEKIWLNFRGINRKGEVFLNGEALGVLDGFMQRGKFDVTSLLYKNGKNILAVIVDIPEHPLNNYGSPTYLSSGGWDWMPYVPGLNSGITDDVYLSNTGALQIEDPWIRTNLPTKTKAELSISVGVNNPTRNYKEGIVKLEINPGNITISKKVGTGAGRLSEVTFDQSMFKELIINNPKLWWPNGYGDPNLYTCNLSLEVDGEVSDSEQVSFGIKKYSYDKEGNVFHISINGERVFVKGGNWGMSEYMLRCRGEEYDTKIRLHKEMNFNMIRNWLGSVTDDDFYEACDKYGIMVWDDFWLNANPVLPEDLHTFNKNAIEKIVRVRNHPSVAVWCGNNEGYPQPPLDNWLKENIATFDGNDRYYQSRSNFEGLSGSGMWGNYDPRWYFTDSPQSSTHGDIGWGFRTEIGTAVFPNYESLRKFIPEDKLWPRNEMWNKHFFGPYAFNALPDKYDEYINKRYGTVENIEEYCLKAQLLNIETNKAMYEGWLDNMWEDASGILIWMSQSAYPSMVWQSYDYYYDLTGAYWGIKKACEPVHVQWNPVTNSVKVVNTSSGDLSDLTAESFVYNMDGSEVVSLRQTEIIHSGSNTATHCFTIPFYKDSRNIAIHKPAVASSSGSGSPEEVTDNDITSRWSSDSSDDQWIYIDLLQPENVFGVSLNFEEAYAKKYKIQVSYDAETWTDVAAVEKGKLGINELYFDDVEARYVRMQGEERGTSWGYSLWDFKVFGGRDHQKGLSEVHFVKLTLKEKSGNLISENHYWRGIDRTDFSALSKLPEVKLKTSNNVQYTNDKCLIDVKVTNPVSSPSVAFAVWVQLHNSNTKERILPAVMSNNYFTLMRGESKDVQIEFDRDLLKDGEKPVVTVMPYNNQPL